MRFVGVALVLVLTATAATAEPLPQDSGILNVHDFGARGDGHHDDTAALLKAIAASGGDTGPAFWQDRIVYLPDGTYLVSDTLLKRYRDGRFGSGLILVGQSRAHTVIRLADRARGFTDPSRPRAVIFTASKLLDGTASSGGKNYRDRGEGNDAYMNSVEDLTIDVGAGNPGAIAIDYLANNIGAVRNVTLYAPNGSGAVGLSMIRKWPGPALVQNLSVTGFDVGIDVAQTEYGLTFDHIRLHGQRSAAIRDDQNVLSMADVTVAGPSLAIVNRSDKGFIAIDGGRIDGRIDNRGIIVVHGVTIGGTVKTATLGRDGRWTATSSMQGAPRIADSPADPPVPVARWANAAKFGALPGPDRDATAGLRRAFASGAAVVYLPHGIYAISEALDVPAGVRRIVGMNSTLKVAPHRRPDFSRDDGMLRIRAAGPPLAIEQLAFDNTNMGRQLAVAVDAPRDVTLRDVVSAGVSLLDRRQHGGRVFLENVCCGRIAIAGPDPVIARQLDTEGGGVRIDNRGSPLYVLGLKTERINTVLDNRNGGRAEIFGGLLYMVQPNNNASIPAFRNADSWLAASFAEEVLRPDARYRVYVADGARSIDPDLFPERELGRIVPDLRDTPHIQADQ